MSAIRLVPALLLPWLLGIAALAAIRPRHSSPGAPGEVAWIVGTGYLAGAFMLTLWMRALSASGIGFGPWVIAIPLGAAVVLLFWVAWRRQGAGAIDALRDALRSLVVGPGLGGAARLVWWAALAWLALRFVLLAIDVSLQPLYPWDAWIQWATKARVWYELGHLAPFAREAEWFAANGAVFFDASPEYPPTVPLLQTWSAIALGRWDDALINWPWWQVAVALAFATYGGLRRLGIATLRALAGAFLVSTLPLSDVHVALAGYADLPLAAYYTAGVLAFASWGMKSERHDAALALLLLFACTQTKNPGWAWAISVLPAIGVVLFPRHGMRIVAGLFVAAPLLLALVAQTHPVIMNYTIHLDFDPAWVALGQAFFLLGNWHLLWYALPVAAALAWRQLWTPPLAPLTVVLAGGFLFLFVVFGFTNAREWVAGQTTVNRAALHFTPLVAIFVVIAFDAFATRWARLHGADPAAVEAAVPSHLAPPDVAPPDLAPPNLAPPNLAPPDLATTSG